MMQGAEGAVADQGLIWDAQLEVRREAEAVALKERSPFGLKIGHLRARLSYTE
jgi:hypothetical protein